MRKHNAQTPHYTASTSSKRKESLLSGTPRVNLAVLTFDGKGNYFSRFVTNDNCTITRGTLLGLGYRVNADCTGMTLDAQGNETGVLIVLLGGEEFSLVRTNPSSLVILGSGKRIRGSD